MKEPKRCPWLDLRKPDYIAYHDEEWGVPLHDDRKHFEFLILEGAQAGLSWYTILSRREHYRRLYKGFDPELVARFGKREIEKFLKDPGIIRNRQKVESSFGNAKLFLGIQEEFKSFDSYIWSFVGNKTIQHSVRNIGDYPATTPESDALSKDLKKRGFKFVGSTIMYAHMQAAGLVNDHSMDCFRRKKV